ncbi:MAG: helix-turn-helix domain-containing protein [Thiolinea sp.]
MEVDGAVFKAARKKIRADFPGRGEPGQPAKGTQEWVADQAKVSLRAVQYLEKGDASFKTLKSVSKVLGVDNWEECIIDYGLEYVSCFARKNIDFRPARYPVNFPDNYMDSIMQMTIDPLSIHAEAGKFESFQLNEVNARLTGLEKEIQFSWLAEVSLTPNMNTWLGWVRELDELVIEADNQTVNMPVMFRQLNVPCVSWAEFVRMVENSEHSQFNIDIDLKFARFDKKITIYVSIDLLKILFRQGRDKYQSEWPYRVQLRTIS